MAKPFNHCFKLATNFTIITTNVMLVKSAPGRYMNIERIILTHVC